jgi:predicted N-acyltransferase
MAIFRGAKLGIHLLGLDESVNMLCWPFEHHPCLHFELCYYRAIDFAITHELDRVEAGAQGQHKLARGYLPTQTHSLHWVGDPGFAKAIARYLEAERSAVEEEIEILTDYGPFKRITVEEQE